MTLRRITRWDHGHLIDEMRERLRRDPEAPKLRASPTMSFRASSGSVLFTLAQRTLDFSNVVADGLR